MEKLLALLCMICPFCVYARMRPESAFARKLREMEKNCPACRAYKKVFGKKRT